MKKLVLLLGLAVILASSSQAIIIGSEFGGMSYVGFELGEDKEVDVGLTYSSVNDDATKTTGAQLRYKQDIAKVDKAKVGWGAQINYVTVDGGATTTNIIGLLSGEYAISDAVGIYTDIAVLNYQTVEQGGTSVKSYWLITGPFMAYTGFKIYL
jgi:hypothetical protein